MSEHASWMALVALGAFHGINPAMGWLFAVALGLQENRRSGVIRALLPLAAGHALAILAAIAFAMIVGLSLPLYYLRWIVAAILIAVGLRFLIRHPHLRWAGMRVSMADLTVWSFLVASVHGAGLMVVPIFLGMSMSPRASAGSEHISETTVVAVTATVLHAASYLAVTTAIALLVFEKFGVGVLRKTWFNLNFIWAAALMATGAATLIM
jgi:hypothetical protein